MKTVLVTGANKGIGLEIARQLLAKGCRVLLGARQPAVGEAALAELKSAGGESHLLLVDVSEPDSIAAAVQAAAGLTDRLDALVNNAGFIVPHDDNVLALTGEQLFATMTTNTLGALRMTQAFRELLERSDEPRVINVSSGGGQLTDGADGWAPAYCISKTALNGVTCQLATALPKFAINSVCPGWVRTDMGGAAAPRSVEQGADTIVWLATEAPQSLTAQFLRDRQPIPW